FPYTTLFRSALGILIFTSQLPDLIGVPWMVYPMVAAGLIIIYLLPRITTAIPAPLVAIVILTAVAVIFAVDVPTVGDKGELPDALPTVFIPDVPSTW